MKVVLTGATGLIGSQVLEACIQEPTITLLVVMTRRPLPQAPAPTHSGGRVQVVTVSDFLNYDAETREALRGVDACIWCLGKPYFPDLEQAQTVSHDYTLYGARAMAEAAENENEDKTKNRNKNRPLRFVYVSGSKVERDPSRRLWFLADQRRLRGRVELAVLGLATAATTEEQLTGGTAAAIEPIVARPAIVLYTEPGLLSPLSLMQRGLASFAETIPAADLGRGLVRVALDGYETDTVPSSALWEMGKV